PDIVEFPMVHLFERRVEANKLVELDPFIEADFELEGIHEGVIEYIRSRSAGKLYALSPTFTNAALFYNTELFDEYNIEYPHNQMTWQEVIELAGQFPTEGEEEERIYGFHYDPNGTTFGLIKSIGRTYGLQYIDEERQ